MSACWLPSVVGVGDTAKDETGVFPVLREVTIQWGGTDDKGIENGKRCIGGEAGCGGCSFSPGWSQRERGAHPLCLFSRPRWAVSFS